MTTAPPASAVAKLNTIQQGDCVAGLDSLPAGSLDLVFADPPFNIGYDYDVYDDRREHEAYLDWSRSWISGVYRALKADGTFWLAIGDEYAAELKLLSQEIGFTTRSWVIWYYTFGVNCKSKFSRSHAHLFHLVKDPQQFTFRAQELENRIPSARQLVYGDARSNPVGRLPDDTWILRPQDLASSLTPDEDTWYFPRVAGTFKERAGFHGCQMPEQLLGRIIRVCSHENDVVADPFSGSATTLAVAKKLGRRYLGFELSPEYAKRGLDRLSAIKVGDPLDGSAEPVTSAPRTVAPGAKKKEQGASFLANAEQDALQRSLLLVEHGLIGAFVQTHDGYSADRVVADPALNAQFAAACGAAGLPGEARSWNHALFNARKAGKLADIETTQRTELPWHEYDSFLFASELALCQMLAAGSASLEDILCDPEQAAEFDQLASRFAPGLEPLWYRWGALKLRKEAKGARTRAGTLRAGRLSKAIPAQAADFAEIPNASGLFVVATGATNIYVGAALDLQTRLERQFGTEIAQAWEQLSDKPKHLELRYFQTAGDVRDLLGYQSLLVTKHKPKYNFREFAAR